MQKTRQQILEYLKQHNEATVTELSRVLDNLTPVTVRHHLDIMRSEGLIEMPEVRHRISPGRPQYTYRLTAKAEQFFPKNIAFLTNHIISEVKSRLSKEQTTVIFENTADRMASEWPVPRSDEPMTDRLERVTSILNQQGYMSDWEKVTDGFLLRLRNCPYGEVALSHTELCTLDTRYLGKLLGTEPHQIAHKISNDTICSYLIAD
jgi:predicted ArsR family transcriptional regulator